MTNTARTAARSLVGPIALLVLAAAAANEAGHADRLRLMPAERRRELAANLESFDALPRDEREAIRALDARLAAMEPAERSTYFRTLRRYHNWLATLTDPQRQQIRAARGAEATFAAVHQVSQQRARSRPAPGALPRFDRIEPSSLLGASSASLALAIKTWIGLPPDRRAEVERIALAWGRFERLKAIGAKANLQVARSQPAEDQPGVSDWLETLDLAKAAMKGREKVPPRVRPRLSEAFVLSRQDAPRVAPDAIARFDAAIPAWLRESLDPLPPEAARRRLAVLFRLAYPEGEKLPEILREPARAKKPDAPAAAKPTASPAPF